MDDIDVDMDNESIQNAACRVFFVFRLLCGYCCVWLIPAATGWFLLLDGFCLSFVCAFCLVFCFFLWVAVRPNCVCSIFLVLYGGCPFIIYCSQLAGVVRLVRYRAS
ncbi:hypothetical protein P8452_67055 [Trifolium repens]|nr:hypothetical protein P8452_67055 [Trifolium repens]